jgi:hypothetical protein
MELQGVGWGEPPASVLADALVRAADAEDALEEVVVVAPGAAGQAGLAGGAAAVDLEGLLELLLQPLAVLLRSWRVKERGVCVGGGV